MSKYTMELRELFTPIKFDPPLYTKEQVEGFFAKIWNWFTGLFNNDSNKIENNKGGQDKETNEPPLQGGENLSDPLHGVSSSSPYASTFSGVTLSMLMEAYSLVKPEERYSSRLSTALFPISFAETVREPFITSFRIASRETSLI